MMAISGMWNDPYGGRDYYAEQERRYREDKLRAQQMAMAQQQLYNPYTDTYGGVTAEQIQGGNAKKPEPKASKAAAPEFTTNKNLLLLEK